MPAVARTSGVTPRIQDDHGTESVRRQASVQDGEAIKIVIHDVDCDPNFSKSFVVLIQNHFVLYNVYMQL